MNAAVFETREITKLYESLDTDEQTWIRKMVSQLALNAMTGKPLRFDWFREKKYKGKRLYYLVYKKANKVLLVAFGNKKEQQKIINHILQNIERYNRIVGPAQ